MHPIETASAGGHFNPDSKQHGAKNPSGSHAGDLLNIVVGANGAGAFDATTVRVSLASGIATSLFDADGSALVIHQSEDDELTDPTGNSGARTACGLIALSTLPKSGADGESPMVPLLAAALGTCTVLVIAWRRRRA